MSILITNDDGIRAEGIFALYNALSDLDEVIVVAPSHERSGASSSFTIKHPLRIEEVGQNGSFFGYGVDGTPADAVKLALNHILPEAPSLVVSGINRGDNSGVNVIYSGTVAGALEGAVMNIPSLAISLSGYNNPEYKASSIIARQIVEKVIRNGLPDFTMLNVNVPMVKEEELKGIRVTRQMRSHYEEGIEINNDPHGRNYFWIGGSRKKVGQDDQGDITAVEEGYVSITPIHADMTNHSAISTIRGWLLEE